MNASREVGVWVLSCFSLVVGLQPYESVEPYLRGTDTVVFETPNLGLTNMILAGAQHALWVYSMLCGCIATVFVTWCLVAHLPLCPSVSMWLTRALMVRHEGEQLLQVHHQPTDGKAIFVAPLGTTSPPDTTGRVSERTRGSIQQWLVSVWCLSLESV